MSRRTFAVVLAVCSAAVMAAVAAPSAWGDTPVPAAITSDTTWTAAASPYVLSDDVTITRGHTLTIQPGTVVEAAPGAHLFVVGALKAVGTETDPIVFGRHAEAEWGGIVLVGEVHEASDTTTTIRETVIEFAQTGVHSRYDAPTIDNTFFANNKTALRLVSPQDRAVTIADNVFANNGTALFGQAGNTVNVLRNDFWNNAVNIVAGPKPVYDCPDPAAAWEIHQNDILRGPQNAEYWSYDVQAKSDFLVDATDNWWGTNNEDKVQGRIRPDGACCPFPDDMGPIDVTPVSQSPNTAWAPTGNVPDPAPTNPSHGDPAFIVEIANPQDGDCISRHAFSRIRGGASAGVSSALPKKVRVAVRRQLTGGRCVWWGARKQRFVPGQCGSPVWFKPRGISSWSYRFPRALPAGRYTAFAKAGGDGHFSAVDTERFRLLEGGTAPQP